MAVDTAPAFLLDTNICIYIINGRSAGALQRFSGLQYGQVGISSITGAELCFGVSESASARNQQALDKFLAPLEVMPFDEGAMREYGRLRAHLEACGTPIGAMDLLIAAHALALSSVLVTNNLREFRRVPGLSLENWADG